LVRCSTICALLNDEPCIISTRVYTTTVYLPICTTPPPHHQHLPVVYIQCSVVIRTWIRSMFNGKQPKANLLYPSKYGSIYVCVLYNTHYDFLNTVPKGSIQVRCSHVQVPIGKACVLYNFTWNVYRKSTHCPILYIYLC